MDEQFTLKINSVADSQLTAAIVEWSVDTNIFLPSMFTLLIQDDESETAAKTLKYTDNQKRIKIGVSVEISVTTTALNPQSPVKNQVFKGEITAIEPVFGENGSVMLRLRGFDRGHRLTMGKNTRTFGDANPQKASLTDSQIVSQVAKKAKLTAKVNSSGLSGLAYHYLMQYDQNDWEFLWARAQMLGYQVYVADKTLHFCPASEKRFTATPETLVWGTNLRRFEPRIVSSDQVNESSALGWNPDLQKKVKAAAKSEAQKTVSIQEQTYGEKALSSGLQMSTIKDAVLYPVIRENNLSNVVAKARFAEHQSQFVRASGELLYGDPRLLAGTVVEVKNVGERFSGKYYVTEARHTWRRGDYRVRFEVSGREPYTLRNLLLGREMLSPHKMNGVVIGVVTDIVDPQKLGRVKVKFPWLPQESGAELSSNWARLVTAGAGSNRGLFFTPEVEDEVLIAFEQGDVNYPYVVGALWSNKKKPPKANQGNAVDGGKKTTNQRIIRSRSGHIIVLDDTAGQEKITIEDKTKKNTITIDSKNNSMTIKAQGNLTLEAGGKLILKSKQDFLLEAKTSGQIKASTNLNMQGQAGALVKAGASQLDLKAATAVLKSTKVDVQGQVQTTIQGTQTSIKGTAMVEVQGALVKIN